MNIWRVVFAFIVAMGIGAAQQVRDMSGTWQLNVARSSWGKHPKPTSGTVVIEHREPAFKYSGTISMQVPNEGGEDKRSFAFDGAIDGQSHPVTGSAGEGTMSIQRVSASAIASEFKSKDGAVLETAKTSLSADAKTMTRELKANGLSWVEIYERK